MDMSQLCRSCMKELSIWENVVNNEKTLEMFYYCTNIKVACDEKLPKQFCNDCIVKLESSYTYITEAQKTDITLRNLISRSVNSVIVEPERFNKTTTEEYYTTNDFNADIQENLHSNQLEWNSQTEISNNEISEYEFTKSIEDVSCAENTEFEALKKQIENSNHNYNSDETKKNICVICRKSFVSKTWFTKHMEKEHAGQKHTCSYCQKTFAKASQLRCHLITHSNERKFPCTTCGKRFKCKKQLSVHAKAHSDARPYECDKCDMRFKKSSILKCHMKVHENVKQFLCSYCGWSFAQACNLEVHIRRHTGERPFACGSCGFRAAAASNLARHARAHTRLKTHVCHTCGATLCDASSLARHRRTHTGERPFACLWCARRFPDAWKRRQHAARAHPQQHHQ